MENNLSNIKERILYLAENVEVSKQEFFKKIDITYSNFTGSKKKRPVNSDAIKNILRFYPQTNVHWLLTGKGDMLTTSYTSLSTNECDLTDREVIAYIINNKEKLLNDNSFIEVLEILDVDRAIIAEKVKQKSMIEEFKERMLKKHGFSLD